MIQYLLVELEEGTTREQLEGMEPDFNDLHEVTKDLMLVIVTAKGLTGTYSLTGFPAVHACPHPIHANDLCGWPSQE